MMRIKYIINKLFISKRRSASIAVFGAVLFFSFVVFIKPALAFDLTTDVLVPTVGFFASIFFSLLGNLLTAIVSGLVAVAQYNKIIDQETVRTTWRITRDLTNMFFMFSLLIIAFSTILRYKDYQAKQKLPRIIFYAVAVNFSLIICGFFIDIAQIIMMTFVHAFEGDALSNLTSMTGLLDYGSLSLDNGTMTGAEVLAGYFVAIAFMIVAIVVIGAMVLILLYRILMLWILVILSPFAFVLRVIPKAEKYAGQWWDLFSKYVISGPLLAFFIWLALTVVSTNTQIGTEIISGNGVVIAKTKTGDSGFLITFIIAMGMLFAGLQLTSALGGAMSKIAGGASSRLQSYGTTAGKWAAGRIGWSGAAGGALAVSTGGASLIAGALGGMGARPLGRFAWRSKTADKIKTGTENLLEKTAFDLSGSKIFGPTIGKTATALRGYMRAPATRREAEVDTYLKGRSPAELRQIQKDSTRPADIRDKASMLELSGVKNQKELESRVRRMDKTDISKTFSYRQIERLVRSGIDRPEIFDAVQSPGTRFQELSQKEQEAIQDRIMETKKGVADPRASSYYKSLSDQDLWGHRFTKVTQGESVTQGKSSNDLEVGDLVIKADNVNLGNKAGSTVESSLVDTSKISGANQLLRGGLKDGNARLAMDFDKLGLSGSGRNLNKENKALIVPKIIDQLNQDKSYSKADLEKIENELNKSEKLTLINKNRKDGSTSKELVAHEAIHNVVDDNIPVEQKREIFAQIDPQKQAQIEKDVRAAWGNDDKMSKDDVIDEYLTNGLTNETRWGDKRDNALKLDETTRKALTENGVLGKVQNSLIRKSDQDDTLKTSAEIASEKVSAMEKPTEHKTLAEQAAKEEGVEYKEEEKEEEKDKKPEIYSEDKSEAKAKTVEGSKESHKTDFEFMGDFAKVPELKKAMSQVTKASGGGAMADKNLLRLLNLDLKKSISSMASKITGAEGDVAKKVSAAIGKMEVAREHYDDAGSSPLEKKAFKDEYNINLKEINKINEKYDIINEQGGTASSQASPEEIEKAIGDIDK